MAVFASVDTIPLLSFAAQTSMVNVPDGTVVALAPSQNFVPDADRLLRDGQRHTAQLS